MDNLDSIDIAILHELSRNGRVGWRELAEKVGLSLTPTLRRVRRLEEEEYILGYAAILNEGQLGRSLNAVLSITLERQSYDACALFEDRIMDVPSITFCGKLTGRPDYIVNAQAQNAENFNQILSQVAAIPGVKTLQSNFMLKLVRPRRPPARDGS